MQKETEELSDLVLKLKRLETSLSAKVDQFVESERAISDYKKELTLEVEELKLLKQSLPKLIDNALKESSSQELPKMLPSMIKSFKETTTDLVHSTVKEAERLKNDINKMIHEAQRAISSGKKEITLRSIGMTLVFCVSSIMTAVVIFYFFPQHVHYGFNSEAARYLSYGIAYAETFDELSQKDKDIILNKSIERLRKGNFS